MALSEQELRRLIQNPRESIDTELKEWIDPGSDEGKAKIAKGCIALFNANGGYLIIGFKNDGKPAEGAPAEVRNTFHTDVIQGIVGKYASHPIPVDVEFAERDGVVYPILCVPGGVQTPCAAKSGLMGLNDKPLIKDQAIYVRSVSSSNTVSTTEPRIPDWERLVRTCHDNREADIGAFFRRHLTPANLDILRGLLTPTPTPPTLPERTTDFLEVGKRRFQTMMAKRNWSAEGVATFEASIVIDGTFPQPRLDDKFYYQLQLNKPRHSGWSFWIDAKGGPKGEDSAYVDAGGWEALIKTYFMGEILDFWRAEPAGRFYHLRNLQDDAHANDRVPPKQFLDFALHTGRVAEVVSIGSHFARALGCDEETTTLGFACRWTGLAGRHLYSWSQPSRSFYSADASVQDEITTEAVMPLVATALSPTVESLIAPVFGLFGGWRFESSVIEGIVKETVNRHM